MKNRKLSFEEVREIQKNMLFSFADFCESHSLRYSLGGGTLLGAVRHQGFIPWDADVDVMMPRPDYEVFLRKFRHERYHVAHYLKNKDHLYSFAKMYDSSTFTFCGAHSKAVFIDIFPIDSIIDSMDYTRKMEARIYNYFDHYKFSIEAHKQDNFFRKVFYKLLWIKYLIKNSYFFEYLHTPFFMAKQYNAQISFPPFGETSLSGAITGLYGEKEIMPTKTFLEYIKLPFEGRLFSCIRNFDDYLTSHYGDYMQIPSKEEQISKKKLDYYWK